MDTRISRRRFFGWVSSRFFAGIPLFTLAAMGWSFLSIPGRIRLERKVAVGTMDGLRQGITVMKEHGIAIVRSGDTFGAVSLSCTHLGCMVAQAGGGFACPCHGSRFGSDGRVLNGPALNPLARYELEITGDRRVVVNLGATLGSV